MDLVSAVIAVIVAALFLVPAVRWPTAGRLLVALVFLGGAALNLAYTLPRAPASLEGLVATSFVPFYKDVIRAAVGWNMAAFTLLVVAFELAVGLLVLWRGPLARLALLAAAAWAIGMLPVVPPDGILIEIAVTGAPGVAALLLARHTYARAVPAALVRRARAGEGGTVRHPRPAAPDLRAA